MKSWLRDNILINWNFNGEEIVRMFYEKELR